MKIGIYKEVQWALRVLIVEYKNSLFSYLGQQEVAKLQLLFSRYSDIFIETLFFYKKYNEPID